MRTSLPNHVGPTTSENVEERIQTWRESDTDLTLDKWLGLNEEEYEEYFTSGRLPQ